MSPRMLATGCFVALALFLQPVAAQTMYKSTMPEPNAVKVESSKPDTAKTGVQLNAPGAEREVQKMEAARASSEAKDKQMRDAEEAVRKAEAAIANGKEPLPGERIGTASGKSRLNDAYWERQKKLREDLVKARDNLTKLRTENQ